MRKDPNAWSLREAVELCKLLEVVVPEAGFHIALTGGLLYKEGKRKNCDLMFYQIRQMEPNYEVLWKYLTVAGVLRSPSYPENGWLVKATYRGKLIDCLFPNAGKKKKTGAAKDDCYKAAPPPAPTPPNLNTAVGSVAYPFPPPLPPTPLTSDMEPIMTVSDVAAFLRTEREEERRTGIVDPTTEARRRMAVCQSCAAPPYTPAELLATPAPAPIPNYDAIDAAVAASRIIESAASAFVSPIPAAAEQYDIPF